jgi:hypothetical protein
MLDRAAVFVGPGLTEEDMSEIDTDLIDLHPPIRRGDLRDAMDAGYRIIAIIDGEFYQNLAVSPKEILVGLRDGRHIIGGSSMGALRAAEMDVYGMEGVGRHRPDGQCRVGHERVQAAESDAVRIAAAGDRHGTQDSLGQPELARHMRRRRAER